MNRKRNFQVIAIAIGLLFNSGVFMASHFLKMPDFLTGALIGTGIGIMLLPFLLQRLRPNY